MDEYFALILFISATQVVAHLTYDNRPTVPHLPWATAPWLHDAKQGYSIDLSRQPVAKKEAREAGQPKSRQPQKSPCDHNENVLQVQDVSTC